MGYDFRQTKKEKVVVHVYKVNGKVDEYYYKDLALAKRFADMMFKKHNVYKVKVWDLTVGPIIANNPNAEALVYERM